MIDFLFFRQVDGIIWDVPENDENREWAQSVKNLPVPIVIMSMKSKSGYSVVSMDSYLGAQMATEHLLAQGCRHIGHISGSLIWWEAVYASKAGQTPWNRLECKFQINKGTGHQPAGQPRQKNY